MSDEPAVLSELKSRLADYSALKAAGDVLSWDESTKMPPAGAPARGRQMAVLNRMAHEILVSDRTAELLAASEAALAGRSDDDVDLQLVALVRREHDRALKVPPAFLEELGNHAARTFQAWQQARPADDFSKVGGLLERSVELSRQYSSFFPEAAHPADPHIDRSDPGFTVSSLRPLFAELRDELVPLVEAATAGRQVSTSHLRQPYDHAAQLALGVELAQRFGYDLERGRLDLAPHPFATSFSVDDVRITTRVNPNDLLDCLGSVLHETGHALYELGVDPALEGTPLRNGASSGVHESQSRLWENLVGNSRAYWQWVTPLLKERFPQLAGATAEELYGEANRVERSLIRTESDELTYNLHVIVRFELELALLEGSLSVADLPEAWRQRYTDYLGVTPPDDRNGVMQDVHWFAGLVGGAFQGYTIGNVLSVQVYRSAERELGPQEESFRAGEFAPLHDWLRTNLYRFGKRLPPLELIERVTGGPLSAAPYLAYLQTKYSDLYGF